MNPSTKQRQCDMMINYHPNYLKRLPKVLKNQVGFTLIELMVGIVVIIALSVVAAPTFEALVHSSDSNRAMLELVSDLQMARMKAIRTNRTVTVTFNLPNQDEYTMEWMDPFNGQQKKEVQLDPNDGRIQFDPLPPGGGPTPDDWFDFTNLGLIRPSLGGTTGNIYLVNNYDGKRYCITTTPVGGIDQRKWNGTEWSGPDYIYFAP